jgi:DNA-binding response OmpR family regulator
MKNFERQHLTILIVEDIDWIRSAMKKAVEREGYGAVEATNDAEAFQLAEREPPELILTEEELPTFDALMARLRDHATLSSVPVVIVNPDAENGARHGDAYLLADYADITSLLTVLRY